MTVNLAVDYVVYPAIIGAIGLAAGIVVKIARKFDWSNFPSWIVLMVAGAGSLGAGLADMSGITPAEQITPRSYISGQSDSDNAKRVEYAKIHYDFVSANPQLFQEQPSNRVLPKPVDGALAGAGAAMLAAGIVLMGVYLNRYSHGGIK